MPIISGGSSGSGSGGVPNAFVAGNNGGDLTTTSATFVDLTGMAGSIAAVAGDKLLITFRCTAGINLAGVTAAFKVMATTSTNIICAPVSDSAVSGDRFTVSDTVIYTVVSGDISGGNVAIKVQFASNGTQTLTIKNSGSDVPHLTIANLRQ